MDIQHINMFFSHTDTLFIFSASCPFVIFRHLHSKYDDSSGSEDQGSGSGDKKVRQKELAGQDESDNKCFSGENLDKQLVVVVETLARDASIQMRTTILKLTNQTHLRIPT